MKKKRERRIAMLLAIMMLVMNLIVSPVWAAPGDVAINEANFPDENFRNYVKTEFDEDSNGTLSQEELNAVTRIDVKNKEITDLKGVEYFTKLMGLYCSENDLTALDLSKNTELLNIYCSENQLTNLNLTKNTKLKTLYCDQNQLTTLDLSDNLEDLLCGYNQLTALDLTNKINLKILSCRSNNLTTLDLSKNTNLKDLNYRNNKLTTLDLSNNTKLTGIDCEDNDLTTLDLSKNTNLKTLYCAENKLTTLDLTNNTNLENLYCNKNKLTELDVKSNTELTELDCSENDQLTNLDLSKNIKLKTLNCNNNKNLAELDVKSNTELTELDCSKNDQLNTLDLRKNTALTYINCNQNQMETLNLSENTNLETLYCQQNKLTALNLINNTKLGSLYCSYNDLTTLDLSKNKKLGTLYCNHNQLTNLDLSENKKLTQINCGDNQLTNLDLSTNSKVRRFEGYGQKRDIEVDKSTLLFNLKSLHGDFDSSRAKSWVGGDVTDDTLKLKNNTITAVTYEYNVKPSLSALYVTLNVKYKETVTITFDANGHGTAPEPITVNKGTVATAPTDPTDTENNFGGWYTEATCTTKFDFTQAVNADITLYAKWNPKTTPTPETVTITFNANGHGTAPAVQTVTSGQKATAPAELTAAGYIFGGWYKEAACTTEYDFNTPVNANITLYAKWTAETPSSFTVTFDANGHGTAPAVQTVTSGQKATAPAELTAAGYIFGGWYKEAACTTEYDFNTPVNANITLYAKWTAQTPPTPGEKVIITFDKNGGNGTMADVTKNKGDSYKLPACTFTPPAGKEFKAWQVDGTEKNVGDNIEVNGDINIKAVWKDIGSVPPTPPVPPTPYTPYPWIVYPGWYYNFEAPKPKEEKPVTKMEMDWKIEFAIGTSTIDREINGVDSKIKMDVAPYIRDGRTMLPLRSLAEALGFEVEWNRSTRTVVLKDNNTRVEIPVGTNKIIVNGNVYTSDVKPEIKNNRTMLPIANLARALGLSDGKDIIWNSKSKMVTIYRSIVVK
ncbi:InlB B-repeat-containing protein [Peptoniphilus duerdenii]|uniref:InlB B-repeat-containing protein n=1 Tax=Peptoniphilus duerdenii TaxID=507750 RepID=UPI00068073ED|nr:InlB B-repeat-containing protein [Peptoniphilus duerdenii]